MSVLARGMVAFTVAALSVGPATAALTGIQFSGDYFLPDSTTPYSDGSCTPSPFTVGVGVDTVCQIENVTFFSTDFGDTSLRIDFATALANPTLNPLPFSGLVYTSASSLGAAGLTGFTLNAATTLGGFTVDRVLFEDNRIGLNLQGLSYANGDVIALDFQTQLGPVPEPATWCMMIAGFGIVGVAMRRRASAHAIA